MSGGTRIVAIEGGEAPEGVLELQDEAIVAGTAPDEVPPGYQDGYDGETHGPSGRGGWIAPILSGLAVAGWTGFFGWVNAPQIAGGAAPGQWLQWIVQWSVPVLLVLVALLVAMRTSRREAARFADVSHSLARQSSALEERLRTVNTELSLARDFLAAQSRDLEALGRIAVERLSGSAGQLEALIVDNRDKVEIIGSISENATRNMELLRGQLPVIANSSKDVANTIANAGRTAHLQLEDMIAAFQRLNEFGTASENHVEAIRRKVSDAQTEFEHRADQMRELTEARFATLTEESTAHRERLDQDEIASLAAIRARFSALSEEIASHREVAEAAEREALAALHVRFATLTRETAEHARLMGQNENAALDHWQARAGAHAQGIRDALAALTTDHDRAVEAAATRLAAFDEQARATASDLASHAAETGAAFGAHLTAIDTQLSEQREALAARLAEIDASIASRRQAIADSGARAAEDLARKLADFDAVIEEHRERQGANAEELGRQCDSLSERAAALAETLRTSAAHGEEAGHTVDQTLGLLNSRLAESRQALQGTDAEIAVLTDAAVRLLELIQASSDHTRNHIPAAVGEAEERLRGIDDRVASLRDTLVAAGKSGADLSAYVLDTRREVSGTISELGSAHETLIRQASVQNAAFGTVRERLAEAIEETDALSARLEAMLAGVIAKLSEAAVKAGSELRATTVSEIEAIAGQLGTATSDAMAQVLKGRGAELVAKLEEALDNAGEASRETAMDLRNQLAKIDELAGNLENRVTRARERAEEQFDNDFARRAALITEALNSTAIDIAKALSTDVSETAWASYLRGDRGIFTRRAVSLLDNAEAKAVQQHYESDADFRDHVNRYIHDFESMLRQLLSTRDGNALGVTLLSSDMGKLYVALAQGIERLRA
ncbi:MAG: hypothetical protein KGL48_09635 [Sphingomonadales bacterium]|nr:hypothetical protein [Sphingomonadales bacterium]MDE2570038.1 hypothetical protein [Sphingomonadales bacterium]